MGADEEADGDFADRQQGAEAVGDVTQIAFVEELGVVDEHEDGHGIRRDLRGVVNAGPGGPGAFGAGPLVADDLEGLVEPARADARGRLLEQLGRQIEDGLDVLARRWQW